jgi:hypothetical protein
LFSFINHDNAGQARGIPWTCQGRLSAGVTEENELARGKVLAAGESV